MRCSWFAAAIHGPHLTRPPGPLPPTTTPRPCCPRVAPEERADDDLLAGLEGQQNAIIFHTDLLGEVAIVQRGGGLTQTAYALLSDLLAIGRDVSGRPPARRARS